MENVTKISYLASGAVALITLVYLGMVTVQLIRKERKLEITTARIKNFIFGFFALAPLLAGIYYLPEAFVDSGFWSETVQFANEQKAIYLFGGVLLGSFALARATIFFPHGNVYYNIAPFLLFITPIPGVANAINVMIINTFISGGVEDARYLLLFFALTTFIYIVTIRQSKRETANLGVLISHKLNMEIVRKTLRFSFRDYEKVEGGKIYTLLNDDVQSIFMFSQNVVQLYTNAITALLVTIYMYTINLTSSLMLLAVTAIILGILGGMVGKLKRTGHLARLRRQEYTTMISGLINGFKELILHGVKREKYEEDTQKSSEASFKALQENINVGINATIFSELSFTIAVGVSCLLFPLLFNMDKSIITSYVIAVLFLWGPFNALITGIPQIANMQVSRRRIKDFLGTSEVETAQEPLMVPESNTIKEVDSIVVENCRFDYDNVDGDMTYGIGPINFLAKKGELIFIVGGNGSGKTTFLKMLVGLYAPTAGKISINGKEVGSDELGECFSIIYSDFYLFRKIYDLKAHRLEQVYEWLDVLGLSEKVHIEDGAFSTIDLSQGQRKRLAIIKSYLEDRPVYFFDEVAADLDPEFRSFFYNHLLLKIKEEGKILIIISHDDKYFHLADKIYKMDMGEINILQKKALEIPEVVAG